MIVVNGVARVGGYISMSRAIGDVFDKARRRGGGGLLYIYIYIFIYIYNYRYICFW